MKFIVFELAIYEIQGCEFRVEIFLKKVWRSLLVASN
jgi:hypothetical protein